ncbi:oligosaccharide flippase family protein [Cesiribacter andamanensis]|uniref:Polysaccharide biosynthesis protein n=1 Tax=Cesiribacter andamanensis AMV16 TaxID=1279009 RepID=M7N5K5_9BACT|nr:oligosaccharide flippase family protein [Cesiribacter andamanensis]EMR02572.1 Polysaccharide biosynthesis protein [Cesiribacter andamanensis AMV16]
MLPQILKNINVLKSSSLFVNSFWGILSNILQNIFLTLFFVILARQLGTDDFAQYLISNALYLLLAAFSTLGLSQWFIRELDTTTDERGLITRFFKIQFYFGLAFYVLNALTAWILYSEPDIRIFSLIFGFNIIFDNIIYAIKALNIAKLQQKITFKILIIEAVLLFALACSLYLHDFSAIFIIAAQVVIRFFTLNLFIRMGTSRLVSARSIARYKVAFQDIQALVLKNWVFVIIGSISLVYWRSANIIVSKFLPLADVAIYAITYKVFSVFIILPLIVSSTVYPALVRKFNQNDPASLKHYYQNVYGLYFLYGLLSFSFIYSFSDILLPFIFSETYQSTAFYTKEMFLTMLVFPTAILQANLLVAIKQERMDMWINLACLAVYAVLTAIGFYIHESLTVIYLSIFISFLIFHIIQDVVLIRKNILTPGHMASFYLLSIGGTLAYVGLVEYINQYLFFIVFWLVVGSGFLLYYMRKRNKRPLPQGAEHS